MVILSSCLHFFTLNFNLIASIENMLQKVGGLIALLQLCKIHQRLIYRVNVLICSGCYLLYIASSDVLKDKFHTKVDKLTRFFLCCCFTSGHGSLIPTRGAGELAVCRSPSCTFHVFIFEVRHSFVQVFFIFFYLHTSPTGIKSGRRLL